MSWGCFFPEEFLDEAGKSHEVDCMVSHFNKSPLTQHHLEETSETRLLKERLSG